MKAKKKESRINKIYIGMIAILVLLMAGVFVYQSGSFTSEPKVEVKAENSYDKTIHVITDADYSPYSFYDDEGNEAGHDVELINMIANELHMNLDLKFMEWDDGIKAMDEGKADILMTCDYSDSFAGVDVLLKSEPISTDDFIAYSKEDITRVDQLYDKTIGIMETGNVEPQVKMLNLVKKSIKYKDNRTAMQALEDGRVDCAIMRYAVGDALIKELGYSDIQGHVAVGQSYMCFGFAKDNQKLVDKVNGAIEKLKINGELHRLNNKWLTTFVHTYSLGELIVNNAWIIVAFILLVLVFTILFYRNTRRKTKAEEEKNQYVEIVENLANDFECVNFVEIHDDKLDDKAVLIRTSDALARNIPGWGYETNITNRLSMFNDAVVAPEDKERFFEMTRRKTILQALQEEGTYFVNFEAIIDGETQYYQLKCSGIENEEGKLRAMVMGFHDVSEEEKARLEQQKRLKENYDIIEILASEYTSVYYIDLTTDGLTPYSMNEDTESAFGSIFRSGISYSEAYRMYVNQQVLSEDKSLMMNAGSIRNIIEQLNDRKTFITTYRDAEGHYSEMKFVKVGNEIGKPVAVALGFADKDEEIRNEMKRKQRELEYQHQLEIANKSKTDFLFNMSHDIRTPMNAIIGFTQLAKKHIDDKDRALDSLSKIESSGNHLLNLINEVLDMSRVESGKMHSDMKIVDVSDAVAKLVSICRENAVQKNINLTHQELNIVHPVVMADELHINQIIMNLLGNAIKYTEHGGNVSYTVEETESHVPGYGRYVFTIEDNGIGMSKEFLEHVFDSFSREDDATIREIQGTGLGMSIVKRLVEYMDGKIEIESEKGKGTKVQVTLHLILAEKGEHQPVQTDVQVDMTGKKALLVEDNELNREIATELLEEQGIEIETAENGIEAVQHIRDKGADYYDFVLMDIQMPMMNGYEATKEIRKLNGTNDLPIIALSANAFEEDKQKSLEAGMNDHVAKPIVMEELMKALARFVR